MNCSNILDSRSIFNYRETVLNLKSLIKLYTDFPAGLFVFSQLNKLIHNYLVHLFDVTVGTHWEVYITA